jgi:hypothetical protein
LKQHRQNTAATGKPFAAAARLSNARRRCSPLWCLDSGASAECGCKRRGQWARAFKISRSARPLRAALICGCLLSLHPLSSFFTPLLLSHLRRLPTSPPLLSTPFITLPFSCIGAPARRPSAPFIITACSFRPFASSQQALAPSHPTTLPAAFPEPYNRPLPLTPGLSASAALASRPLHPTHQFLPDSLSSHCCARCIVRALQHRPTSWAPCPFVSVPVPLYFCQLLSTCPLYVFTATIAHLHVLTVSVEAYNI